MGLTIARPTGPSVQTAALPGARLSTNASAESFGQTATPNLTGVLDIASKLAAHEKQKADNVMLLAADNQLNEIETTAKNTALSMQGMDAMGATAAARQQWDEGASKVEATLTNDDQREAFVQRKAMRGQSLFNETEGHAHAESMKFEDDQTLSALGNRLNAAIDNPGTAPQQIAETQAILAQYADHRGWDKDTRAMRLAEAASKIHVGVINRMLADGNDQTASQYYTAHGADVVGQDKASIEQALEVGSTLGASQRNADTILGTAGATEASAYETARAITDPKTRKATEDRLDTEFARRDRVQRDAYESLTEQVYSAVITTGRMPAPGLLAKLKPRDILGIRSYLKQQAKGDPVETDWGAYYKLSQTASSDVPAVRAEFLKENLMAYRGKLADAQLKEMMDLQGHMRKGDTADDEKLTGMRTQHEETNGALTAAGFDPSPKDGTDDARSVEAFRRKVNERVVQLEQQTKQKAAPEDVRKIADDLMISGTVQGSGFLGMFQTHRKAFDVQPGEHLVDQTGQPLVLGVQDIPTRIVPQLKAALQRRGLAATDDAVLSLYKAGLARGRP